MRRKVLVLVFSLMTMLAHCQVSIVSKIDSVTMLMGHQVHMTVEVTARPGAKIVYPHYKRTQNIVPGIEVLSSADGDSSMTDGFVKKSHVFTLTSFDEKLYSIPGVKVKVDGKEYRSNPLALKVLACEVDTLHPEKICPPKSVQDNPFMWEEWSPLFWLGIVVVLLCVLVLFMLVRLYQNKPIISRIRIVKRIPPHTKALDAINELKTEHFDSTDEQKTYYTKLTDTLRMYIRERFGFNAMEMTSTEILYKLQEVGNAEMLNELRELFTTADLVKFAKYSSLLNEKDMNLVNAINFIDQTKRENEPTEEKIVSALSDDEQRAKNNRITIKVILWSAVTLISIFLAYIIYNMYMLLV